MVIYISNYLRDVYWIVSRQMDGEMYKYTKKNLNLFYGIWRNFIILGDYRGGYLKMCLI